MIPQLHFRIYYIVYEGTVDIYRFVSKGSVSTLVQMRHNFMYFFSIEYQLENGICGDRSMNFRSHCLAIIQVHLLINLFTNILQLCRIFVEKVF